jgi:F0F1-type ATP synthase delta subunit
MSINKTIKVFAASEMDTNTKSMLENKLKNIKELNLGGDNYSVEYFVDTSLLTGFYIQSGDTEIHHDLKNQLEHIITELVN